LCFPLLFFLLPLAPEPRQSAGARLSYLYSCMLRSVAHVLYSPAARTYAFTYYTFLVVSLSRASRSGGNPINKLDYYLI
jgi:hypothetical protein